jgi:hypothetical protein|tara:strand:+ start:541 stop:723 length:183 start_codon:yes stop_codon:yes gene_type:complete
MSYITDIANAIISIKNNAKFGVRGENKDTKLETLNDCEIDWNDGETPISKTDIKAEMDKL